MASLTSGELYEVSIYPTHDGQPSQPPTLENTEYSPSPKKPNDTSKVAIVESSADTQGCALKYGQALDCCMLGPSGLMNCVLNAKDIQRWTQAANYLRNQCTIDEVKEISKLKSARGMPLQTFQYGFLSHVPNFPSDVTGPNLPRNIWFKLGVYLLYPDVIDKVLAALLFILPIIYGGIHLTARNFDFASKTELLLWKIACLDIMATFIFLYSPGWLRAMGFLKSTVFKAAFYLIGWALGFVYALSRVYLVVESFISLRYVPIGVFAAIPWVQDIPHI